MKTLLLSFTLKHKRDLLRARKVTRLAADLLGFQAQDQACLAAAAFDLAWQALSPTGRARAQFDLEDDCLQITFTPVTQAQLRQGLTENDVRHLSKRLPASAPVPRADVPWMLQQITALNAGDLFEEVRKANQELLETLLALAKTQTKQPEPLPNQSEPSAA